MADEFERESQAMGLVLYTVYTLIAEVCGLLPIPITLPDFEDDTLRSTTMIEAVTRITEVIEDEPISEGIMAGLWGGCLHWLSAAHLLSLYTETGKPVVAMEIRLNTVTAHDTLHAVEHALLEEREE